MKCSNEKCKKDVDPEWDHECILINCDGDFVCSQKCKNEYEQQKDYFYEHILPNEEKFKSWLQGRDFL